MNIQERIYIHKKERKTYVRTYVRTDRRANRIKLDDAVTESNLYMLVGRAAASLVSRWMMVVMMMGVMSVVGVVGCRKGMVSRQVRLVHVGNLRKFLRSC